MSHHLISFCLFIICLSHRGGHIKQVQDQTLEMSVHQHSRRERAIVDSASNVINTTLHVALEDGCLNFLTLELNQRIKLSILKKYYPPFRQFINKYFIIILTNVKMYK